MYLTGVQGMENVGVGRRRDGSHVITLLVYEILNKIKN